MNKKYIVNAKDMNSLLKAIDIHLELLQQSPIFIKDEKARNEILKSMEYLKIKRDSIINNDEKQLALLKRNVYSKYLAAKKELINLKNTNENKELIVTKSNEVNNFLDLYISLKDMYNDTTKQKSSEPEDM